MLTEKAQKIFDLKYAAFKGESWEQACWRIASHIASAEDGADLKSKYEKEFFNLIYNLVFLPGGRILANSGTGIKNLNNCFVLPIEDSRQSIYGTLKNAAEVFAWGGGVGYNFSHIRAEGEDVKTTGGKASGPLSFMSLFDQTGEVISQASRRGAQMGMLSIYHKDIEKFINYKSTPNSRNKRLLEEYKRNLELNGLDKRGTKYFKVLEKTLQDDQLSHFNISVIVDDAFMGKAGLGEEKEKNLLMQMAQMAWESGDPGIFFLDRANEDNLVPYLGELECTNPCGEIPLLPYEPCCLGSINLHKFYIEESNSINFPFLEYVVRNAIRFLDNVQSLSETPVEEINTWSKGLRRLGLGVMGWADLLAELELPYDSEDAKNLGKYLSWFISFFAILESINLAQEKGRLPMYDHDRVNLFLIDKVLHSEFNPNAFNIEEIKKLGLRNVSVTSIAPTGTIALMADVNSGIEPFFALSYKRNITEGVGNIAKDYIIELNPILEKKLIKYEYSPEEIEEIKSYVSRTGSLEGLKISEKIKRIFSISHEISPYGHVDMQASWQMYITNAVSKTINCPEDITPEEIFDIYKYMWNSNLKGGTIYRDKSKTFQILNLPN